MNNIVCKSIQILYYHLYFYNYFSNIKKHQIILNVIFQTACILFTLLIFVVLFMYLGEEGNNLLKT